MDRFIIDETTNTLVECKRLMMWERLDYLIIPHQYNGKQIDHIGPHCFDYLMINLLCIEEGVKYLDDCALENAQVFSVKLPRGLKIGERCFAGSQLTDILLPRDLYTIKKETFLNCENLTEIYGLFGITSISYSAFSGCVNLKKAHFRLIRSVKDFAFYGCASLHTLELGYRIEQLGRNIFDGCSALENLELDGAYDKFHIRTFEGAKALHSLNLSCSADSLYIPPDCFKGAPCLKEITVSGTFEPIVEKRSCFPDDIIIKGYFNSNPLKVLSFYFNYEVIA